MLRKKKSTFDESDLPTDNWIWGNSRGGGGAPLRDLQGNDVANLKKVFNGAVSVDHSPSPKGKFKGPPNFRDDYNEDEGDNRNRRDNEGDRLRNGRARNNSNGAYNDADDGYPPDNRRGGVGGGGRGGGAGDRRDSRNDRYPPNDVAAAERPPREKRNSAYRGNYSDEQQERVIPGLNDRSVNMNDPNSPRYHHGQGGGGGGANGSVAGSPKKFMSAIKDMASGGDNRERDLKLK